MYLGKVGPEGNNRRGLEDSTDCPAEQWKNVKQYLFTVLIHHRGFPMQVFFFFLCVFGAVGVDAGGNGSFRTEYIYVVQSSRTPQQHIMQCIK